MPHIGLIHRLCGAGDAWQISGMMPCVQKGLSECESVTVTQLRFFMSTYSTIALAVSSYTPARPNVKQAAATTRKPSNGTTVSTSADDGSSDGCIGFGQDRRALHPADNGGCIPVHTLLPGHRHCPRPNGASWGASTSRSSMMNHTIDERSQPRHGHTV